jgi:hypothetical protein
MAWFYPAWKAGRAKWNEAGLGRRRPKLKKG